MQSAAEQPWDLPTIRFPGQYYDEETETPDGMGGTIAGTGLHYNYHRYYDPSIGRFSFSATRGSWGSPVNTRDNIIL
jgi:RHS repeat-associated protein